MVQSPAIGVRVATAPVTRFILLLAVGAHPLGSAVQCPLTGNSRSSPDDRLC